MTGGTPRFAVINHLHLTVPAEDLRSSIEAELHPVFHGLPGFEGFYLVKEADDRAIAIVLWDSAEHAQQGGAAIGPTWFNQHITPKLAGEQQPVVGPVITFDRG